MSDSANASPSPSAATDLAPVRSRFEIRPEWTDQNGHMNVAFYVLAFDQATDIFLQQLELGWTVLAEGRSIFTLAMNVDYLNEVFAGETIVIESRLLDCDSKRLHYYHQMTRERDGELAATNEIVAVHVSMATRRSAPLPDATAARARAMKAAHAMLPRPPRVGRTLGLAKRPARD